MNPNRMQAVHELERLRRRVRRRAFGHGLLGWGAVAAPVTTAAIWLAGGEHVHGGFLATGLSLSLLAALAGIAVHQVWRPWRRYSGRRAFARLVEARGDFGNVVVAADEADRHPERWPETDAVTHELARRREDRALTALAGLTPAMVHPVAGARRRGWALIAGLTAMGALALGWPDTLARGVALLADPRDSGGARMDGGLFAEPSAPWVAAGGQVTLGAADFAAESRATHCEIRFGDAAWTRVDAVPSPVAVDGPGAPGSTAAAAPAYRRWRAEVTDVREDFAWRFRRGETVTRTSRVIVRQPPLLSRLSAHVEPPDYMGLPVMDIERLPALSEVPIGSRVTLTGTAGHALSSAWLATGAGDSLVMSVHGVEATLAMTLETDLAFTVGLRDDYGLRSREALGYRLTASADRPPTVTLVRPGDDGRLPLDGHLNLLVEASDDFGLRRLDLWVATAEGSVRIPSAPAVDARAAATIAFGPRATGRWLTLATADGSLRLRARASEASGLPLQAALTLEIEAGDLRLLPGDVLELAVEAWDNRAPGAGQMTRSEVVRLALPSAADVLAAQAESAERNRAELEEARRRNRELDADLQRLTRELMKNPAPDWARQQEIEAALERQQAMQKELARLAEELRRQMEELASGQLTSEAQLERTEQMSELLNPPSPEQLSSLLDKLARPEAQVAPDEVARAMDEVTRTQQDLARRLDAALALMQRMADEQQLEGLTSLLEEMMRKQQELADLSRRMDGQEAPSPEGKRPDGADPEGDRQDGDRPQDEREASAKAEDLARRQEALARELEQLREKLERALAEKSDVAAGQGDTKKEPSAQEQALRDALEKLKQQQASGSMGKASQMLQQMDPRQAAQMQQQALRDLGSLYSVLLASQQAMQAAMKMEQVSSLRGLAADLLSLSERQEDLGGRIPVQLQDVRNVEVTRQQHRLQKAAMATRDELAKLLDEAPNRILKLLEKLDELIAEMGGGVRALDEGRAAAARESAGRSLAGANRIVIGLLTEAQMSGGGGGGGGQQQSASEQLQELARQQAELNGATEELRRMLADRGISQQARSQMQRLGQQQAELGRNLGRIQEQERQRPDGDGPRLLGDMEELGRQMERVGRDLGDGQVDQAVLERQDRILGRLLDARNSVRERDYSSRRESRSASRIYGTQQGEGRAAEEERRARTLRRYQRLENAPPEYRELVRRYFAAIDSMLQGGGERSDARDGVLP